MSLHKQSTLPDNPGNAVVLNATDVRKSFGGIHALSGVSLKVEAGKIHALVGENGAGKSTLIKILTGAISRDSGTILLDGKPYLPSNPAQAKAAGIQCVYQELNMFPDLSIAENVTIERFPRRPFGLVNFAAMRAQAISALSAVGLDDMDPDLPVQKLGIAHKQLIEIARALSTESKILILDEPTATLTDREVQKLAEILMQLRTKGLSILFVSHHLEEVFRICDQVTVFRNGQTVASEEISNVTPELVVRHMVGRALHPAAAAAGPKAPRKTEVLAVADLKTAANPKPHGVSFSLKEGEVLGLAGLVGAGRTEVLRAIFGAERRRGGTIRIDGAEVRIDSPSDAIRHGIAFVTEDRKGEGLILPMAIKENLSLVDFVSTSRLGLLNKSVEAAQADAAREKLKIKLGRTADAVSSLSGGNQQKVVLGKWLTVRPRILLLDEPTRGVDVGAKAEIYEILRGLAAEGTSILVVSSELPELMALCDRIMVLSNHQLSGELNRDAFSEEALLKLAYGQNQELGVETR
jgi:ribose transport system ATP-binding protein